MNERHEDDLRIAERAAQWHIRLNASDAHTQTEFMTWLEESPKHVREFLLLQAIEIESASIDPEKRIEVASLIDRGTENVVPLSQSMPAKRPSQRADKRSTMKISAALAAGVAVAAITYTLWFDGQRYSTSVGEQRTITLADGSVIDLNTDSRLKVRYSATGRDIQLMEGEAMFNAAKDASRPFRVHVGTNTVQAIGTQFNVNRRRSSVMVSVIEGAIQISGPAPRKNHPTAPLKLIAGEEVRVAKDGGVQRRSSAEVARSTAWREHRLVFREDTLEDIASEFNRYNRAPKIVIADSVAGARRYGGIFNANDPGALVRFLEGDGNVTIEATQEAVLIRGQQ